ncbi:oxidoreductase, partial [Salmonella enterica subsp. enterica serovar Typhimurium]
MVHRVTIAPQVLEFSRFVMGYSRLMDWNMFARQLVGCIEDHLVLGVTTVDHAESLGGG